MNFPDTVLSEVSLYPLIVGAFSEKALFTSPLRVLASLIALPSWSRYCTVTEPCSAGVAVSSLSYLNVTVVLPSL